MMDRSQTAAYLREDVDEARSRISKALIKWENSRRVLTRTPRLPPSTVVWLPTGPEADLRMLTLVVWCSRYCVSMVWLLDALMTRFKYARKLPNVKTPEELSLGVPAATLTGAAARRFIEEKIVVEFPNRENVKSALQRPPRPMPELDAPEGSDFVASYIEALRSASVDKRDGGAKRPYRRAVV